MLNSIFIAADPPMPPTGGGVRTLNFSLTLSEKTNCKLFILFPVNKNKLPGKLVNQCSEIHTSNVSFSTPLKGRINIFFTNLRWLLAPWSFKKSDLVLLADYLVSNPYTGNNKLAQIFNLLLKYMVVGYALTIYRLGYRMPARSLERLKQFNEMQKRIHDEMNTSKLIWIDFSTLFAFFTNLKNRYPGAKINCNAHNIEYKVLERMELLASDKLEKIWCRRQAAVMKNVELNGFKQCDRIFTCSELDKQEIIFNIPTASVDVFPNGVDTEYFIPNPSLTEYPSLLFTGTMGYRPTRDAVLYFIEKIFPYVTEKIPNCKFIIAGANAGEVFKNYKDRDEIEIISSPPDMRPAYDKSWIVVVPLRVGGGTRLKILEAMAMEKPVVSTSIGVEGIEVNNIDHLLVADEEKEFADKINFLINETDHRIRMTINAKKRTLEIYGWNSIRTNLGKIIENIS